MLVHFHTDSIVSTCLTLDILIFVSAFISVFPLDLYHSPTKELGESIIMQILRA